MFDNMPDSNSDVSDHAAQMHRQVNVVDAHSALEALALRNHGTSGNQRDSIVSAASQYMPDAADNANDYDGDCADAMGSY